MLQLYSLAVYQTLQHVKILCITSIHFWLIHSKVSQKYTNSVQLIHLQRQNSENTSDFTNSQVMLLHDVFGQISSCREMQLHLNFAPLHTGRDAGKQTTARGLDEGKARQSADLALCAAGWPGHAVAACTPVRRLWQCSAGQWRHLNAVDHQHRLSLSEHWKRFEIQISLWVLEVSAIYSYNPNRHTAVKLSHHMDSFIWWSWL